MNNIAIEINEIIEEAIEVITIEIQEHLLGLQKEEMPQPSLRVVEEDPYNQLIKEAQYIEIFKNPLIH